MHRIQRVFEAIFPGQPIAVQFREDETVVVAVGRESIWTMEIGSDDDYWDFRPADLQSVERITFPFHEEDD